MLLNFEPVPDHWLQRSPSDSGDEIVINYYPGAAKISETGDTARQSKLSSDRFARRRKKNVFYPFSCFTEWEIAQWLSRAGITQQLMNEFFKLKYVSVSYASLFDSVDF